MDENNDTYIQSLREFLKLPQAIFFTGHRVVTAWVIDTIREIYPATIIEMTEQTAGKNPWLTLVSEAEMLTGVERDKRIAGALQLERILRYVSGPILIILYNADLYGDRAIGDKGSDFFSIIKGMTKDPTRELYGRLKVLGTCTYHPGYLMNPLRSSTFTDKHEITVEL